MRAALLSFTLILAGCGNIRGGGGTAVGNPGKTVVRLAPDGEFPWDAATATALELKLTSCDPAFDDVFESRAEYDLVGGVFFDIPPGSWCSLEVSLDAISAVGETLLELGGSTATLPLDQQRFDDGDWIVELGSPSAPQDFVNSSALFRERVADGRIDPLERSQGPVAAGPDRPVSAEADILLVVGFDGLRAPLTDEASPTYAQLEPGLPYRGIAHDDGLWVAVGGDVEGAWATSTDAGLTWQTGTFDDAAPDVTAYDNTFYAATFAGPVLTSTDGTDWQTAFVGPGVWQGITSGPGGVLAVGQGGVAHSPDGAAFTRYDLAGDPQLWGAVWGPPGFVAVGEDGDRWHSPDGATWTLQDTGGTKLTAVEWTGRRYVAVGEDLTWFSDDGLVWTPGPNKALERLEWHDGALFGVTETFVFVSNDEGGEWFLFKDVLDATLAGLASNR